MGAEFTQSLGDNTLFIFDFMSFIDNEVLPLELFELGHADPHAFESCNTHIEIARNESFLENNFSLFFRADQVAHLRLGEPLFKFEFPIGNHSLRTDYQVLPSYLLKLPQEGQKSNALDRLTESHLVS